MVRGQPGNDPVTTYAVGCLWLPEQEVDKEQVGKPGFILIQHDLGCVTASRVHLAGEDKTPTLQDTQLLTRRTDLPPASAYELAQHIVTDACEQHGPEVLNPIQLRGCINFGESLPTLEDELNKLADRWDSFAVQLDNMPEGQAMPSDAAVAVNCRHHASDLRAILRTVV